jgi:citrate lyase subunit beta/citryl-CoA lyase/(S)-citramalyl-CoA lyase
VTRPAATRTGRDVPDRCVWLVTPGAAPGRFAASMGSGADVALLDLEDSVRFADKDTARMATATLTTLHGG